MSLICLALSHFFCCWTWPKSTVCPTCTCQM